MQFSDVEFLVEAQKETLKGSARGVNDTGETARQREFLSLFIISSFVFLFISSLDLFVCLQVHVKCENIPRNHRCPDQPPSIIITLNPMRWADGRKISFVAKSGC
jgi:hypothetical protein